jgi:nucleoside-diphosphate-sugar epimerase
MVTGATGLIGYNLIKSLLEDSHKVFAVIRNPVHSSNLPDGCIPSLCNILDSEPITEIVSRSDMIFHLAGIVGVGPSKIDPYNTIDTNIIGAINIMDAAYNLYFMMLKILILITMNVNNINDL